MCLVSHFGSITGVQASACPVLPKHAAWTRPVKNDTGWRRGGTPFVPAACGSHPMFRAQTFMDPVFCDSTLCPRCHTIHAHLTCGRVDVQLTRWLAYLPGQPTGRKDKAAAGPSQPPSLSVQNFRSLPSQPCTNLWVVPAPRCITGPHPQEQAVVATQGVLLSQQYWYY